VEAPDECHLIVFHDHAKPPVTDTNPAVRRMSDQPFELGYVFRGSRKFHLFDRPRHLLLDPVIA
jgi:hypothetical protein